MKKIENEEDFRKYFIKEAEKDGWHVSWVEAHTSATGIVDLILVKGKVVLFIELKVWKDKRVRIRPPQKRWHREVAAAGGTSYIAVLFGDFVRLYNAIDVIHLPENAAEWQPLTAAVLDGGIPHLLYAAGIPR